MEVLSVFSLRTGSYANACYEVLVASYFFILG